MKKNDFFDEDPPAGHEDRVRRAVTPHLDLNRSESVRSWRTVVFNWKALSVVTGGLAVALFALRQQTSDRQERAELVAFQSLLDPENIDQSVEDLNVLADDGLDLELIENLELIEEMEDV